MNQQHQSQTIQPSPLLRTVLRTALGATFLLCLSACTTQYPEFRDLVRYRYLISDVPQTSRVQRQQAVTIHDQGEALNVISPVEVQACDGRQLRYSTIEKTRKVDGKKVKYKETKPVMVKVDPLADIYLRRVQFHNGTPHTLSFASMDIVFVDPTGTDYPMASRRQLAQFMRADRPCPSTRGLIKALSSLTLLNPQQTLLPNRTRAVYLAFPDLKLTTPGRWRLELHNVPTKTNRAGGIVRRTSFTFPFDVKKYQLTVRQRKEGLFKPWREVSRNKVEIKR